MQKFLRLGLIVLAVAFVAMMAAPAFADPYFGPDPFCKPTGCDGKVPLYTTPLKQLDRGPAVAVPLSVAAPNQTVTPDYWTDSFSHVTGCKNTPPLYTQTVRTLDRGPAARDVRIDAPRN